LRLAAAARVPRIVFWPIFLEMLAWAAWIVLLVAALPRRR
jgi:hypothetical protein